jgi:hypothetical protein
MKFSEIPKFTKQPSYSVEISWKYLEHKITELCSEVEGRLDLNPDFQHGHIWTVEQQIAYVEFILRGGNSGHDIYFNHPGWMNSFKCEFVIVDGLQRLTAALKFMNNEIPAFGCLYKDYEDRFPWSSIGFIFHVNDLKTRAEVLQWYIDFNSGGTPHTEEEITRVKTLLDKERKASL